MSERSIAYSSDARDDIHSVFDYLRLDDPSAAEKFLETLDRTVLRLARFPQSGFIPRDKTLKAKSYRCQVLWDYLIFHRFSARHLFIVRLVHGRRHYAPLLLT